MAKFNIVAELQHVYAELAKLTSKVHGADYVNKNAPKKDPSGQLNQNRFNTDYSCRVTTGFVIDSIAPFGWYNVQLDDSTYLPCGMVSEVASGKTGVKRVGVLQPGERVIVVVPSSVSTGYILGASPGYDVGLVRGTHDYISQASTNTVASDGLIGHYANLAKPKLLQFSNHSPVDETSLGEWGRMAETGVGVFVDPFMAYLRSDENCGFWAFWHDQLARMHGHNLQIRSPGMDIYSFDDESELSVITGYAPYLWEALGGLTPAELTSFRTQAEVQTKGSQFATVDMATLGQVPFHRLRRFDGYLGQGFKQQLKLPPQNTTNKIFSLPVPMLSQTVWEEHLALDGNYHMVSSQGIFLAHVPPFSSPIQTKTPENGTGDSRFNNGYVAGGYNPNGSSPHVISTGPINTPILPGTGSALNADDELAYGLKWRSAHPFVYHQKDWTNPADTVKEVPQGFSALKGKHYLEKPAPLKGVVDHRQTNADYHPTLSFVSILRDGTVVIAGPAGEEIRMGGGSIELSCPGDIQLRPGRNLVTLAGRDAITRARSNVELSSSEESVRIKSEYSLELLAGNSGRGGLILESRSASPAQDFSNTGSDAISSGITLKSQGFVSCVGTDVFVRAGLQGRVGNITLDASKGKGAITAVASQISNYVTSHVADYFGEPGKVTSSNYYSANTTIVASSLQVMTGTSIFGGGAYFKGSVAIVNGTVIAEFAKQTNYMLPELKNESKKQADEEFVNLGNRKKLVNDGGTNYYKQELTNRVYLDKYFGNDKTIATTSFSFRTTAQCKATDFMLFESRWAQRARANGETVKTWEEKSVAVNEVASYPYPGSFAWLGKTYRKVDSTLYTKGSEGFGPKDPATQWRAYEAAGNPSNLPEPLVPNKQYPVIE